MLLLTDTAMCVHVWNMTIGDYAIRNPDSINNSDFYIEKKTPSDFYIKSILIKSQMDYSFTKKNCNQNTAFRVYPFLNFLYLSLFWMKNYDIALHAIARKLILFDIPYNYWQLSLLTKIKKTRKWCIFYSSSK